MTTLRVNEQEMKDLARRFRADFSYNAKGFFLFVFGPAQQHHIRVDLKPITSDGRYAQIDDQGRYYRYDISSFHVKREAYYTPEEQDYDYLYFAYGGSGVWQPVWGYQKTEKRSGGYTPRYDSTATTEDGSNRAWSDGTQIAREFIADLQAITGMGQQLAMGPVRGAASNLVNQL